MTSPKDRRIGSQRSLERENSLGDDPWCLTCGANLALEGRSYTAVSRHNNSELCDIFSRVLGAEFSPDYASVNVCNRCERQLRRLGRYNSIVLARHEGEKLREQLERNLAKHDQKVVESGRVEDIPSPSSDTAPTSTAREDTVSSSIAGRKGQAIEVHSSIRKSGKRTSRSVSNVHFEDEGDTARKETIVRKYSAPVGGLKKRESLSPFSEAERRREARRRKWSSASSTSDEYQPGSPTTAAERRLLLASRGVALTSLRYRDANRFSQKSFSIEQPTIPDELTPDSPSVPQEPPQIQEETTLLELPTAEGEMASPEDKAAPAETSESLPQSSIGDKIRASRFFKSRLLSSKSESSNMNGNESQETAIENPDIQENLGAQVGEVQCCDMNDKSQAVWVGRINPFDAEKQRISISEHSHIDENIDDDVFVSGVEVQQEQEQEQSLPRMDSLQAEDDLFPNVDTDPFKEDSPQESEFPYDADVDGNDVNADSRSCLSEVEERITTKTKFKGAYYNIGSTEDLLQEFANEQDRERAMWSKLTFTESVDIPSLDPDAPRPVRPPRRSKSGKSSLKKKGRKQHGGTDTADDDQENNGGNDSDIAEEASENGGDADGTTENDKHFGIKANGVALDEQNGPSVNLGLTADGKSIAQFTKELSSEPDKQTGQEGSNSMVKSEKSPLIGKDGLKVKNGNESRVKDQMPGFLCCAIL